MHQLSIQQLHVLLQQLLQRQQEEEEEVEDQANALPMVSIEIQTIVPSIINASEVSNIHSHVVPELSLILFIIPAIGLLMLTVKS
jgi:hypothetical protein